MVPLESDQPGGRAKSRAVTRVNGSSVEKDFPHEADLRGNWSCQGSPFYLMASVGAEELRSTHRGFRRIEGGNTRKYSSESPEGLGIRQDDLECQRVYNRLCREMTRRSSDWRMRPISVDGRDNTTRLERGPQGTGGDAAADGSAHGGGNHHQFGGGIIVGRSKRSIRSRVGPGQS